MKKKFTIIAFILSSFLPGIINAQCDIPSTAGYTVFVKITAKEIVPTAACATPPYPGYNYNLKFDYKVVVSGTNNTYNGNIQIQPNVICNSQSLAYYSINVPAPTVGSPYSVNEYYGTQTTTVNPYRTINDCGTATPFSMPCTSLTVSLNGPGISVSNQPCSVIILPVVISNFSVNCVNDKVLLQWATSNEVNNNGFVIERSMDAANWQNVGTTKGAGNSSITTNYTFTDAKTDNATIYYRLKQIDLDGNFKYSGIVSVQNCSKTKNELLVFPKPSNGLFNIAYTADKFNIATIEVYNSTGQRVYVSNRFQPAIDLYEQNNGVYYLKLTRKDNTSVTQKLFIVK